MELAASDVAKKYNFVDEADRLINKLNKEHQILVRISKRFEKYCLEDIN